MMQKRGLLFLLFLCSALFLFQRWQVSRTENRPVFQISQMQGPLTTQEKILLNIPLSVNQLSAEELKVIPHIGLRVAQRIVAYRLKAGPFKSIEELLNVKGIGEKTVEFVRPFLTVTSSRF